MMGLRRWTLAGSVVAWLVGLGIAGYLPLATHQVALLVTGLALGCGAALVAALVGRLASTSAAQAPWLRLIFALWLGAALVLGMARMTWAQPASDPHNIATLAGNAQVSAQGVVDGEPDERAKGSFLTVRVTAITVGNQNTWQPADGVAEVFALGAPGAYSPEYGDAIEFSGVAHVSQAQARPGIDANFGTARVSIAQHGGGNPILAVLYRLRVALAGAIAAGMPAPEAALLIGILLGLKTPELRSRLALFTKTGTIHLVVTSGLKVTLVGALVAGLTRRLPRASGLALALGGIALYVVLSGAGPAALRAGIMGALLVLARWLGRDYDVFNALAVAALLMTALAPFVLWDVGFQLSAAGTLGIAILAPRLRAPLTAWFARVRGGAVIADVLAATIAAQVSTLPIVATSFGIVSLIAPLTNLILVPLLPVFLVVGALVGGGGLIAASLGATLGAVAWPLLRLADIVIEVGAALPGAALTVNAVPGWLTPAWVAFISLVPLFWRAPKSAAAEEPTPKQRRLPLTLRIGMGLTALVVLFALAVGTSLAAPPTSLTVTFLDAGAGGPASLIRLSSGRAVLVDGGSDGPALLTALTQALPFWQRSLDVIVVTDVRPGHIAALHTVLQAFHVGEVVDPGALHPDAVYSSWYHDLQTAHVPLIRLHQGDRVALGPQIALDILTPTLPLSDGTAQQDANALIMRLVSPGLRVLFTGDADDRALAASTVGNANQRADIVQVCQLPNEGILAQTPLADMLATTRPRLVLVAPSARTPPKAGTPAAAPTPDDPLAIAGMLVIRTAQAGTTTISSDGSGWRIDR